MIFHPCGCVCTYQYGGSPFCLVHSAKKAARYYRDAAFRKSCDSYLKESFSMGCSPLDDDKPNSGGSLFWLAFFVGGSFVGYLAGFLIASVPHPVASDERTDSLEFRVTDLERQRDINGGPVIDQLQGIVQNHEDRIREVEKLSTRK